MKTVAIAGSTGSIGTQTIEVVGNSPDRFHVSAIGANSSVATLGEQANIVRPDVVAIADDTRADELTSLLDKSVEVRAGNGALASLAHEADVVVNAVVGFAGIDVTLESLCAGKRLALANKESLVAGGQLVRRVRDTPGAELLPIDSEHGALHQCMRAGDHGEIRALVVTASGGPFREKTHADLASVTVEDALSHPTWKMGPKITIDSSTLFNKGLEVIEAHELFDIDYDDIEVVVHPQSIVHSAVTFTDGSTIAHMSRPDMRLPIGYAHGSPDRLDVGYGDIDWASLGALEFSPPDRKTFRCLDLAFEAGRAGGTWPAVLNAANEIAVQAFLDKEVAWLSISAIIEETLDRHPAESLTSTEVLYATDAAARKTACDVAARLAVRST